MLKSDKFYQVEFSTLNKYCHCVMHIHLFGCSFLGGISLAQRPERYVELSEVKSLIQQRSQDLELLKNFNDSDQVVKVLAEYPMATAFLPLKTNVVDMTVLISKEKSEVVKIVDLRPWN